MEPTWMEIIWEGKYEIMAILGFSIILALLVSLSIFKIIDIIKEKKSK